MARRRKPLPRDNRRRRSDRRSKRRRTSPAGGNTTRRVRSPDAAAPRGSPPWRPPAPVAADGPSGNHARASAVCLTGRRPPDDGGVHLGVSADQIAAAAAGRHTRLPSLEIGCETATPVGHCDDPYSCAYTSSISWKSETTPQPPDVNPRDVFDRLFAGADSNETQQSRARRAANRKSVLDFVREDAADLRST